MAQVPVSASNGRVAPHIHRSFTLPTNLSGPPRSSPNTVQSPSQDGSEVLFSHHACKIVNFSPPGRGQSPGASASRAKPQDEEPVGILPWASSTERTVALGPIKLYRVHGVATYLSSGRFVRTIMNKSVCWCVDGESKFVLRIGRSNDYYRIELPRESEDDQEAAEEFKTVLARVLQYETTVCPFKRGFYVELPEQMEVIYKPWTPKHSPITSLQQRAESSEPSSGLPRLRRTGNLELPKLRDRNFDSESTEDGYVRPSSAVYESLHSGSTDEDEGGTPHVETVVSGYENMKSPEMLTPLTKREDREDTLPAQIWMHSIPTEEHHFDSFLAAKDQEQQSPENLSRIEGATAPSGSSGSECEASDFPKPPSTPEGEGSISTLDEIQDTPERFKIHDSMPSLPDNKRLNERAVPINRSFTAPVSYQPVETASNSDSMGHDQNQSLEAMSEVVPDSPSISATDTTCAKAGVHQPPVDLIPEFGIDEPSVVSGRDTQERRSDGELEEKIPATLVDSGSRSSTPEWLGLSPVKSSFPPSIADTRDEMAQIQANAKALPTMNLADEEQRETAETCVDRTEPTQEPSPSEIDCAVSEEVQVEIPSVEGSPTSQLRHRFRERRLKSSTSRSPVTASPPKQLPQGNLAVRLLQSIYSLLLVPIIPIVAFVLTSLTRIKHGIPEVEGPIDLKRERQVPCAWESDTSADEKTSVGSDDESQPSTDNETLDRGGSRSSARG